MKRLEIARRGEGKGGIAGGAGKGSGRRAEGGKEALGRGVGCGGIQAPSFRVTLVKNSFPLRLLLPCMAWPSVVRRPRSFVFRLTGSG